MLRRQGSDSGGLVCVVTTVKDTRENLDRFVERNLAGGADHLFVFLDDADATVHAHLSKHRHVTAVRTGEGYWHGHRPRSLNRRQWVNANATNVLLTAFPEVAWLVHLDGDEVLDLDRDQLLGLAPDVRTVRLRTLESVASSAAKKLPELFKRPLEDGELDLLTTLGTISRPSNKAYFHGHAAGKSGLRPSLDLRLGVHDVEDLDREQLEPYRAEWLGVLHYESFSVDDFVRKWTTHLRPHNTASFRHQKARLRSALETLAGLDMDEGRRRELLVEIYRRHIEDDVALLGDLGFLVRPRREWHQHSPGRFGREARRDLDELVEQVRALDKQVWFDKRAYAPRRVVAELAARVESTSARGRVEGTLGPGMSVAASP